MLNHFANSEHKLSCIYIKKITLDVPMVNLSISRLFPSCLPDRRLRRTRTATWDSERPTACDEGLDRKEIRK